MSTREPVASWRGISPGDFPILTPQAVDPGRPFPLISNLSVNLLVVLDDSAVGSGYGPPQDSPASFSPSSHPLRPARLAALAERGLPRGDFESGSRIIVAANLQSLFPGHRTRGPIPSGSTRNADMEHSGGRGSDLLTAVQVGLEQRRFGPSVRLESRRPCPEAELQFLLSPGADAISDLPGPDHLDLALPEPPGPPREARPQGRALPSPSGPIPLRRRAFRGRRRGGHSALTIPTTASSPSSDLIRRARKNPTCWPSR